MIANQPIFAGSSEAQALSSIPGVSSWMLQESFTPRRTSVSLHDPVDCLTTELRISGRQWLYEVTGPSTAFSLSSGLLRWNKSCLYESNPSNIKSRSAFFPTPGNRPPGWWHRYRCPEYRPEPLTLLSTHNNPNYFHWLTQPGLAPLFLQRHFNLPHYKASAIAVSHRPRQQLPQFVEPILSFVSPNTPKHISLAISSVSCCRFALQEHDTDVFISPAQLTWLRNLCRTHFQSGQRPWRRVYLSRSNTCNRRCLNEQQLMSVLSPYGFKAYCLESLPVEAQLRLFSESAVVVGPHGAGFSNIIACPSSATIIELLPRPGKFSHYYAMSDRLQLQHGHLLARYSDSKTDNFFIDPDQLTSLMSLMQLI